MGYPALPSQLAWPAQRATARLKSFDKLVLSKFDYLDLITFPTRS
jgi:hypothetical protein